MLSINPCDLAMSLYYSACIPSIHTLYLIYCPEPTFLSFSILFKTDISFFFPFPVGGTSGIGSSTAREFVRHTLAPRVYLVGRNETQASRIISELRALNPEGQISFVKSDVSLLRNVDAVCDEIKAKEEKVNLLVLSQGVLTTKGRDGT